MCSTQAQHFEVADAVVTNHYDKSRNICFVRVATVLHEHNSDKYSGIWLEVKDAFEGFSYGTCFTDADNKVLQRWPCHRPPIQARTSPHRRMNAYVGQTYLSH